MTLHNDDDLLQEVIAQVTQDVRRGGGLAVFTGTSSLVADEAESHLRNAVEQLLAHERRPNGIETVRLEKGFGGEIGRSHIVEYHSDSPYITIA